MVSRLMNTGRLLMNITLVVDARKLTGEVPGKAPNIHTSESR